MDLCGSLIKWLQTFTVESPCSSAEDLLDGVIMARILHQISPQFFSSNWLSKIKTVAATDRRLKVSNLKKVLKGILDFYSETLGQQLNDVHIPDVTAIVENNDLTELGRLLQLILGCAVNCDDKHEYIRRIMNLEESVQHDVMKAIQELMTKEVPASPSGVDVVDADEQAKKIAELTEQKDNYAQRCHDLDLQVVLLQEEKSGLLAEIDRLNERVNQESFDDPNSLAGRRYVQLQRQVEQLQEELYRAETGRDDFRIKAELLQKELSELQEKNEELVVSVEEYRQLKDELDILRHTAEKVSKYEASLAAYKKKLEEMSDVKSQLKILEEKNMSYMQANLDLEEEVKKATILKTQLEAYKRQVQDVQLKCTDETKRADKAEFEAKRQQEKLAALQLDKERLVEERNSLKEMVEELRCSQPQQSATDVSSNPATSANLELMSLPPEVRERVLRLQRENEQLKTQVTSSEDCQLLRSMLDDTNAHKHELECQVRTLNQQLVELEATIKDLTEVQQQKSSEDHTVSSELHKRLTEKMERCSQLEVQLQTSHQQLEDVETKLQASVDEANQLRLQLSKKEAEMKEMEEKYKKYLGRAKTVIGQMDPKKKKVPTATLR